MATRGIPCKSRLRPTIVRPEVRPINPSTAPAWPKPNSNSSRPPDARCDAALPRPAA